MLEDHTQPGSLRLLTTTLSVYDANAQAVDTFAYLFQDFLPVFAAGNSGAQLVDGTITSPAVAKNCMAVGAIQTSCNIRATDQVVR